MCDYVSLFIQSLIPITGVTADVNPQFRSSFRLIKSDLIVIETIPTVRASEPESHPIIHRGCTLSDLVTPVDHPSAREAFKLELALRTRMSLHSAICGISSHKCFFASGVVSGVHIYRL